MCAKVKNSSMLITYFTFFSNLQFQLIWVRLRRKKIQLKLFSIVVTLKYAQGHFMWYEQVKLNEKYHYAKFDISHLWCLSKFHIKVFNKPGHLADKKHFHYLP